MIGQLTSEGNDVVTHYVHHVITLALASLQHPKAGAAQKEGHNWGLQKFRRPPIASGSMKSQEDPNLQIKK